MGQSGLHLILLPDRGSEARPIRDKPLVHSGRWQVFSTDKGFRHTPGLMGGLVEILDEGPNILFAIKFNDLFECIISGATQSRREIFVLFEWDRIAELGPDERRRFLSDLDESVVRHVFPIGEDPFEQVGFFFCEAR